MNQENKPEISVSTMLDAFNKTIAYLQGEYNIHNTTVLAAANALAESARMQVTFRAVMNSLEQGAASEAKREPAGNE